ncbi:hypothetical protein PG985_002548 [Apiospora marii]|uniref:Transmembrane protein n=1 Tax=Apiospora marii TaxID=335849 RepID=A0ABR1RTF9_9PEZI
MDGFVVVELLSNNTYNGTEASLKTSEINNTYLIRSEDFLEPRWERPTDPDYRQFYGVWAYVLATSVVWVPAIAMAVLFMTKFWKDNFSNAQGGRRRGRNDSFELQPLHRGPRPVVPLVPYSEPAPAEPQPPSKPASQAQITLVVGFLLIWRGIGLAIPIQRIIFVAKIFPWTQSSALDECMRPKSIDSFRSSLWPWFILVPAVFVVVFHTVLMVLRIWAAITVMTGRSKMWFMNPLDKNEQTILLWIKIIFLAWVEVVVFFFVLQGLSFRFCVGSERYHDLHTLVLSYIPGIVWVVIDRASRPILRHYLPAFGFPRYPPVAQDALGLLGPIADPSQRTASSSTW